MVNNRLSTFLNDSDLPHFLGKKKQATADNNSSGDDNDDEHHDTDEEDALKKCEERETELENQLENFREACVTEQLRLTTRNDALNQQLTELRATIQELDSNKNTLMTSNTNLQSELDECSLDNRSKTHQINVIADLFKPKKGWITNQTLDSAIHDYREHAEKIEKHAEKIAIDKSLADFQLQLVENMLQSYQEKNMQMYKKYKTIHDQFNSMPPEDKLEFAKTIIAAEKKGTYSLANFFDFWMSQENFDLYKNLINFRGWLSSRPGVDSEELGSSTGTPGAARGAPGMFKKGYDYAKATLTQPDSSESPTEPGLFKKAAYAGFDVAKKAASVGAKKITAQFTSPSPQPQTIPTSGQSATPSANKILGSIFGSNPASAKPNPAPAPAEPASVPASVPVKPNRAALPEPNPNPTTAQTKAAVVSPAVVTPVAALPSVPVKTRTQRLIQRLAGMYIEAQNAAKNANMAEEVFDKSKIMRGTKKTNRVSNNFLTYVAENFEELKNIPNDEKNDDTFVTKFLEIMKEIFKGPPRIVLDNKKEIRIGWSKEFAQNLPGQLQLKGNWGRDAIIQNRQ